MTDEELVAFVGIADLAPVLQTKFIAGLTPDRRATYERMHQVTVELDLWQAGLGPKPEGVIITRERKGRIR